MQKYLKTFLDKFVSVKKRKKIKKFLFNVKKKRLFSMSLLFMGMFLLLLGRFFFLQVIQGEGYLKEYEEEISREEFTEAARGTIYDRNGIPLAYDELAYTVTITDDGFYDSQKERNQTLNNVILQTIELIEENGNTVENVLPITYTEFGSYTFTEEETRLQRFRADVFGYQNAEDLSYNSELGYEEGQATASQIIDYLCSEERFGIEGDDLEKNLKIASIRYAMSMNTYQRYMSTVLARDVNEETIAAISENEETLSGVRIEQELVRRYIEGEYLSHVLGYTGQISENELEEFGEDNAYSRSDQIGKSGIEQVMESELCGEKGVNRFYVDNVGRVLEELEETDPIPGNDVYLTIDSNLQRVIYHLLEQRLAGILYSNLVQGELTDTSGDDADNIRISSDDVYFAIIDNQVLDINSLAELDNGSAGKRMWERADSLRQTTTERLENAFAVPYSQLSPEMQRVIDTGLELLNREQIFIYTNEVLESEVYRNWQEGQFSFREFMNTAISENWLNLDDLNLNNYITSEEAETALEERIKEYLPQSSDFQKLMYELLLRNGTVTGQDICMALYEQGVFQNQEEYEELSSGRISAYDWIREKIRTLQLTPAQLALDPSTASSVVTDPETGDVLASVTYPGYDNNRMANTIDAEYYDQLLADASLPLYNNATQQRTAPGSTFKPVTAAAGMAEGVITPYTEITDEGVFDAVSPSPECWIYPNGSHGSINVSQALRDSCNYFFYETAFRFSNGIKTEEKTEFDEQEGIDVLTEAAEDFGLDQTTGIQIPESEPQLANEYPITAAIGQSNFAFTTTQLSRYAATLANGGNVYALNLISHVEDFETKEQEHMTPELIKETENVTAQAWAAIHSGMEMMADDSGYFDDLPVQIAGKTGTAEQVNNRPNHALFIGYISGENPQIALATRIAYGYASSNAAQVSADIFRYYLGIASEEELINETADAVNVTGNIVSD